VYIQLKVKNFFGRKNYVVGTKVWLFVNDEYISYYLVHDVQIWGKGGNCTRAPKLPKFLVYRIIKT